MRYILFSFILLSVFMACKKASTISPDRGFIKVFESDTDQVVVNSILLDDNSIILVCRTLNQMSPAYMYKMDAQGNTVWVKRLPVENRFLSQAYDVPGDGFVTMGTGDGSFIGITVCKYNNNGDLLSTKAVPFNLHDPWPNMGFFGPFQMTQLSNGNYAIAGDYLNNLFICITSNSFDTLYQNQYSLSSDDGALTRGICEYPTGTLVFSSSAAEITPDFLHFQYDTRITRTDLTGTFISDTLVEHDTMHNETPNALLALSNGMMMVTGRMGLNHDGSGTYVNYLNNYWGNFCAGEINLVALHPNGGFGSRISIRNYPANGVIMSARPTSDGGFILCGTVGQADVQNIVSVTQIYLMKVSAAGTYQWSKIYASQYPSIGVDAIEAKDGGYYISGYQKSLDKIFNPLIIKTDADGND